MVILRIPPLTRLDNLRTKRLLVPLLANLLRDIVRNLVLLLAVRENRAAVLGANIRALAVEGCGVVHAVEEFQKLAVADDRGVEGYLEGFGVYQFNNAISNTFCFTLFFPKRYRYLRPVVPLHTTRYVGDEVCPPEYPTLASKKPFPLPNSLRNRCSTPQKQPAATVAFSGIWLLLREADSGARERNGELVEKGRKRREKSVDPIAGAKVIGKRDCVFTHCDISESCCSRWWEAKSELMRNPQK